ncbi:Spatacsin [Dissostichus eleginoides]|uniref:Spatacsin n=1 Tax=Dissostichus eleginoides TaxID=100907 RepID=A0AAD9BSZ1_DISEL|nr:Spatacsin [Dissostichus eleginoides]
MADYNQLKAHDRPLLYWRVDQRCLPNIGVFLRMMMMMEESGSTEVCVIPENPHCVRVSELRRADLAPGGSLLLGCLRDRGLLEVLDPADREAPPAEACGKYTDFCWEEEGGGRLLAVSSQFDLKLLEAERPSKISIRSEVPAERLLKTLREETLFSLSSSGLISVCSLSDGRLLASIDLPLYLTAVAVTESHSAAAVPLDHYFSLFPDHLLCALPPSRPPLRPLMQVDQDSLWSSSCSLSSLGSTFKSSAPSLLTVTEFSAQLTFVSPGNTETTVALWEMESGKVTQHRAEGEAAPVQRCGERQHRLLLKDSGVFQVLFSVSQEDLLSRLMLFGSAATVDAVCHLNSWGRCSIPIHSLQAGLKNRQLDTVDFYLKSKENILNPENDQPPPQSLTHSFQELCSALDLLCSAVRESNSEAQSRQFSEQLLNITLSFINRQIRSVLTNTQHEDLSVQVEVLDRYVTELRSYMKRFPWPEVVRRSILTNQIPRAQAVLRGRGLKEQRLSALRRRGLQEVFTCLQHRDLHTANTLLTNMGFSVKQQLRSICLFTDDYDLRDFVVEELSGRRFLPEEEVQSVEFMKEMERLGSLPAARSAETPSHRGVQMVLREGGVGEETLRLDWVRNWDQSCRTAVLLSRLPHTEVTSCDAALLWRYLTSLHDQRRIIDWIQNEEVNQNWRGVLVQDELCDLQLLLWRLSQGGGVMSGSPSLPQYRSPLGLDLHSLFISFCVKHSLHFLLYSYLQHHRLTPRNCPLLTNQSLSESEPWFEMMVKIQEISTDLSGTSTCSITRIHLSVLLPGSGASLSSLLLEGHSLLALASLMFSPGGIDQVVSPGRSERTVDAQLLKMALTPHPKLRSALFPPGPRGGGATSDVSVYHLLQALHPLDPCRLFGWQAANTLNSSDLSELPHFSSSHLVSSFALMENLDFLYFLRHGRPSSAFATFLKQQLSGSCDVPLLLQQALQQVSRLAMQCVCVSSITAACVCFYELLGVCSLKLRVDIRALHTVLQTHNTHSATHTQSAATQHLHNLGVRLAEAEPGAAEQLIGCLEAAVTDSLEQRGVASSVYASHCAQDAHFINFCCSSSCNFPPQQVRCLAAQFGPALQAHLSLAFQELQVFSQREGGGLSGPQEQTPHREEAPHREEDLLLVLLKSQEEAAPDSFLLKEALEQRCPLLAVMAACQQGAELVPCLCVWVLTSVDDVTFGEATSHLADAPPHHQWTLHDLSIIWKTLLGRGHVRPLLRGFSLFQRMFELCCDYRNFSEAKAKLLDFQRTLISWVESQASELLLSTLQRCSSQYDLHRLLLLLRDVHKLLKSNGPDFRKLSELSELLQGSEVSLPPRLLQCTSPSVQQEELQAVVDALQEGGRFREARQGAMLGGLPTHTLLLTQLLQDVNSQKSKRQWSRLETRVSLWRKCHDQLQADGIDPEPASLFFLSQAKKDSGGAELLEVQEHCLLLLLSSHWLSRLHPAPRGRLESLEKQLWAERVRGRVLAGATEKQSVFNLSITQETTSSYELMVKEFCFSNIPCMKEEEEGLRAEEGLSTEEGLRAEEGLSTEAGLSKVEGLSVKEGLSKVEGLSTEEGLSTKEGLSMKEGLSAEEGLSMEEGLSVEEGLRKVEGLSAEESLSTEELREEDTLSPEERCILGTLVDQLLDEGSIHEASRVCRYFSLQHGDMKLKKITSSPSFSSLSSFVVLPLPEDQVAVQLQKLVDQCRHGNNFCRQVLSLYQLSKELQLSFRQIHSQDPGSVLQNLLQSEQPERFRKARAFIKAQSLSAESVSGLLASSLMRALLDSSTELQPECQVFRPAEGRDSLLSLIKLCDDPNLVGEKLLLNLSCVPLRELSCIVELLIVAHDCFSLTCNMEGIVRVLQAARHLSHAHLAPREHYGLLVRLLTGIGRYNEMTYVFDLLHQNHRFEMLLRKKIDTDRGQSSSLKTALLDYLKRCLPADSEKHNMVALCFSMRREIGENHEMAARTQLKIIESQAWVVTPELKSSLVKVLGLLKDAAESFSKDSCVRQATRCVRTAKLVALQLHFLKKDSDLQLVNLQPPELLSAVTALPSCYQVLVVAEAYGYSPDWPHILFQKVILSGDFVYLEDFKRLRPLTSALFEDIFKKLDGAPCSVSNARRLLSHCEHVFSRYRLAYQQNLLDVSKALLQDTHSSGYLRDRLAS